LLSRVYFQAVFPINLKRAKRKTQTASIKQNHAAGFKHHDHTRLIGFEQMRKEKPSGPAGQA
jgi:hypothetical protein